MQHQFLLGCLRTISGPSSLPDSRCARVVTGVVSSLLRLWMSSRRCLCKRFFANSCDQQRHYAGTSVHGTGVSALTLHEGVHARVAWIAACSAQHTVGNGVFPIRNVRQKFLCANGVSLKSDSRQLLMRTSHFRLAFLVSSGSPKVSALCVRLLGPLPLMNGSMTHLVHFSES